MDDDGCGGCRARPLVPAYAGTTVGVRGCRWTTVVVVAAPVPWVPAYAGTTVRGRGCRWGITVVVVAAPVPWVPAYAGTTVRGRGCRWGITVVVVAAPVPWVPACRQPSSIGRGVAVGPRSGSGMTSEGRHDGRGFAGVAVGPRSGSGMTNAGLLLRTKDFVHAFLPVAGRIAEEGSPDCPAQFPVHS